MWGPKILTISLSEGSRSPKNVRDQWFIAKVLWKGLQLQLIAGLPFYDWSCPAHHHVGEGIRIDLLELSVCLTSHSGQGS